MQGFCPVENVVFVMVEEEELHLRVVSSQRGSQLARDEVQFVLRCEDARLPNPIVLWFVLRRDCPDWYAMFFVSCDPLGEILRPRRLAAVLQAWCGRAKHLPIPLHPCRRAPSSDEHLQLPATLL